MSKPVIDLVNTTEADAPAFQLGKEKKICGRLSVPCAHSSNFESSTLAMQFVIGLSCAPDVSGALRIAGAASFLQPRT